MGGGGGQGRQAGRQLGGSMAWHGRQAGGMARGEKGQASPSIIIMLIIISHPLISTSHLLHPMPCGTFPACHRTRTGWVRFGEGGGGGIGGGVA